MESIASDLQAGINKWITAGKIRTYCLNQTWFHRGGAWRGRGRGGMGPWRSWSPLSL